MDWFLLNSNTALKWVNMFLVLTVLLVFKKLDYKQLALSTEVLADLDNRPVF